jgi:murein DD-endopeptidase MepM/ murein hydrolase activator NlpD
VTAPVDALLGSQSCAVGEEKKTAASATTAERQRLQLLASEFESMLLNQVLQEMRRSGKWDDGEGESEGAIAGSGNGALFEILDAELAKQLSKSQGFGLSRQLMDAFDRMQGSSAPEAIQAVAGGSSTPVAALSGSNQSDTEPGSRTSSPDPGQSAATRQVTSAFGWRRDPFTGETRFHRGVDLRAAYGEDIVTAAGGRVTFAGPQGSYGNTVVVEHPNGTRTRYAHLSVALVDQGDSVEPGQIIGRAGSSGRATAPHLHLELTDQHGRPLNPLGTLSPLD